MCHSVGHSNITGNAANHLATVVLDHAAMTDFCGIPLVSLRENSITELDLQHKGVGEPGAIVLSKLLPSAVALRSLNLADNELCGVDSDGYGTYTAEGINKLCDGLKGSAVTLLNLQGNYIGAIGAFALAAFLKETPITKLDVGSNHLTDNGNIMSGLLKLVQILPQTKIESLGIGSNCIGDKGASALAAILKETKITTLELGDNNIGGQYDKKCQFVSNTEGIIALCEGLKGSAVTSLECAAAPKCLPFCQRPLTLLSSPPFLCSLQDNRLCGMGPFSGEGTYTVEAMTKLCEALKGSAVTSLKCAPPHSVRFCVSAH